MFCGLYLSKKDLKSHWEIKVWSDKCWQIAIYQASTPFVFAPYGSNSFFLFICFLFCWKQSCFQPRWIKELWFTVCHLCCWSCCDLYLLSYTLWLLKSNFVLYSWNLGRTGLGPSPPLLPSWLSECCLISGTLYTSNERLSMTPPLTSHLFPLRCCSRTLAFIFS